MGFLKGFNSANSGLIKVKGTSVLILVGKY